MNIPVLPGDYPPWSWSETNGHASDAQTRAAYEAISEKGATAQFSHIVWNDLVDSIYNVLQTAGVAWDDTDATYADTKMPTGGIFTATMFNSARRNIGQVFSWDWQWDYDPVGPKLVPWDQPSVGYTGRLDMRGVSEVGYAGADLVYGWYIWELTRRLNLLIAMLSDTAAWDELAHSGTITYTLEGTATITLRYDIPLSHAGTVGQTENAAALRDVLSNALTAAMTVSLRMTTAAELLAERSGVLSSGGRLAGSGFANLLDDPAEILQNLATLTYTGEQTLRAPTAGEMENRFSFFAAGEQTLRDPALAALYNAFNFAYSLTGEAELRGDVIDELTHAGSLLYALSDLLALVSAPTDAMTHAGTVAYRLSEAASLADLPASAAAHSGTVGTVTGSAAMKTWQYPYVDEDGYLVIPQAYAAAVTSDWLVIE